MTTLNKYLDLSNIPLAFPVGVSAILLALMFFVKELYILVGFISLCILVFSTHRRTALIIFIVLLPFSRLGLGLDIGTGFGFFDIYSIWFVLLYLWRASVVDLLSYEKSMVIFAGMAMFVSFTPSIINAADFFLASRGLMQTAIGLLMMMSLFYFLLQEQNLTFIFRLLSVLTIMTALVGLFALYQTLKNSAILSLVGGRTFSFIFGDPNYYAGYLIMVLCISIAFSYTESRRLWKFVYLGISIVFLVSIGLSMSRAAYIVTIIVFLGYGIYLYTHTNLKRVIAIIAVFILCTSAGVFLTMNLGSKLVNIFLMTDRIVDVTEGKDVSVNQRKNILIVGSRIAQDSPLFGIGIGNFEIVFDRFREGELSTGNARTAHNTFLKTFAETGILGFLFTMFFYLFLIYYMYKAYRIESNRKHKFFMFSILVAIFSFYLMSFTLDQIYEAHFWSFAGIGLVFARFIYASKNTKQLEVAPAS